MSHFQITPNAGGLFGDKDWLKAQAPMYPNIRAFTKGNPGGRGTHFAPSLTHGNAGRSFPRKRNRARKTASQGCRFRRN